MRTSGVFSSRTKYLCLNAYLQATQVPPLEYVLTHDTPRPLLCVIHGSITMAMYVHLPEVLPSHFPTYYFTTVCFCHVTLQIGSLGLCSASLKLWEGPFGIKQPEQVHSMENEAMNETCTEISPYSGTSFTFLLIIKY